MKPRKIEDKFQPELLKIQLIHLLDMKHSLVQLADKFNWAKIDELMNCVVKSFVKIMDEPHYRAGW